MIFKIRHDQNDRGQHVHCSLFSGRHAGALGLCGKITMRQEEFEHFAWLTRSRIEFDPPVPLPDRPSHAASGLANRILDQIRLRLTPDEYTKMWGVITVALDDCFEVGVKSAGGAVIDMAPRSYDPADMPALPPSPKEIAADWFTLPPASRTKERLMEMLS